MPVRNIVKQYDAPAYYHVYNRGSNDASIFLDDDDRAKFLALIERYIVSGSELRSDGVPYSTYDIEVIAYCLMGNHFHLLLYQSDDPLAITGFMRSVATAYTMYFNYKYKHHGHLFQSVFKASRISDDIYLLHVTRYIHMNPRSYLRYEWSSLKYYLGSSEPEWLNSGRVNNMNTDQYKTFLCEYEGKKGEQELLKSHLAG